MTPSNVLGRLQTWTPMLGAAAAGHIVHRPKIDRCVKTERHGSSQSHTQPSKTLFLISLFQMFWENCIGLKTIWLQLSAACLIFRGFGQWHHVDAASPWENVLGQHFKWILCRVKFLPKKKLLISATNKVRGQQTWVEIINVKHLKKLAVQRAAKQHWLPIYAPTLRGLPFLKPLLGWRWERDASRQVLVKTWNEKASRDQTACRPVPHFPPTLDQSKKMSAQCQSRYAQVKEIDILRKH